MKKKIFLPLLLYTHYFICAFMKSARVMSFTIFDNVVVVAIAAQMVLHVSLVLPCYVILHFSVFVLFFEKMKSLID